MKFNKILKIGAYQASIFAFIVLLLVACGPATEPLEVTLAPTESTQNPEPAEQVASEENALPSPASNSNNEEGIVEEEEIDSLVEVDFSTNETDSVGVLVGFTVDGHPYRGDPAAPVVIKEFSDFQCPFCSRFIAQTLPTIEEDHIADGTALLIFYDFPIESIHPQAFSAANAARCAGEQGASAFWSMHDVLFVETEQWSVSDPFPAFASFADNIDLDLDAFESCYFSNRYEDAIGEDISVGSAAGINGTPSFLINDQLLVGAQPTDLFVEAISIVNEGGQLATLFPEEPPSQPPAAPTPAVTSDAFASDLGDPNAAVKIVEFTDYQCPYCSRFSLETMPLIVTELIDSGRVYYQLKDLPLEQIHPHARLAATAVRCAGEQDAYWEMHDAIFENQAEWAEISTSEIHDSFATFGEELGLDSDDFDACLASSAFDSEIDANIAEAQALGISGTPFFLVNGYPLNGARPYEHFDYAVTLAEEGRLEEAYAPPEPESRGPSDISVGNAYTLGDEDAPITIIEYTDFQCPYCSRHFLETYPALIENFVDTGIVRYVFKDFPLNNIHPQASIAAEAARCAGDQGEFFAMHDLLFNNQRDWGGSDPTTVFLSYASELGLDPTQFGECLANEVHAEAVNADLQEGISNGVTGTPAFFINGHLLSGAQPYSLFEEAITTLLEEQG
jgi:protein-disulfide isomerase